VYEHNGPDAEVKLVDFGLSCHFKEAQLEHDVVGTWVRSCLYLVVYLKLKRVGCWWGVGRSLTVW
jgi:hypothetical protein